MGWYRARTTPPCFAQHRCSAAIGQPKTAQVAIPLDTMQFDQLLAQGSHGPLLAARDLEFAECNAEINAATRTGKRQRHFTFGHHRRLG